MGEKITLDSVVCPGCVSVLPRDNTGCPHCGYEDNTNGKIGTLREIMAESDGKYNDVSPAFFRMVVHAAQESVVQAPAHSELLALKSVRAALDAMQTRFDDHELRPRCAELKEEVDAVLGGDRTWPVAVTEKTREKLLSLSLEQLQADYLCLLGSHHYLSMALAAPK